MPLSGSVHQDGAMGKKDFHITQENGKWILRSKSTGKVLGEHSTKEDAEAQERAIQVNKHSVEVTSSDMAKICRPCSEKMEKKGVKSFFLDIREPDLGIDLSEAPEGVLDGLKKFALGETKSLAGVQIFSSGTWNGDTYTDKDLDQIVAAFADTKEALKPYLKLGHSDSQTLLAEDELPSAGWVTKIYRIGHKLFADFCDMPSKIYDLVSAKAYKRISSEIFFNLDVEGTIYPKALKAVALLGGETPAVQNLDDIHALYASMKPEARKYKKQAEVRAYAFDSAKDVKEGTKMDEPKKDAAPAAGAAEAPAAGQDKGPDGDECYKQLKQAHSDLGSMKAQMSAMAPLHKQMGEQLSSYKAENEGLKKEIGQYKADLEKSQGELKKFVGEKQASDVKVQVAKFVEDRKILPSQAPALEALLLDAKQSGVKKYKLGETEIESAEALILTFVSSAGAGLSTAPQTESGKANTVPNVEDGVAMEAAVKQYMAKNPSKSFREAYIAVAAVAQKATQEIK